MGLSFPAGYALKKISEYSEFKNYKTVMEYGCQTISKNAYPTLKTIFPDLNLNFTNNYVSAKKLYNLLGLEYNSMDANGEYDSMIVDFNEDLKLKYNYTNKFDLCTNLGTSEHLIGQTNFFKNIHNTTKKNGIMLHVLPMEGYYNHCYFNYHPNFFYDLASSNKYEIKEFWYFSQRTSKTLKHYNGNNLYPLNFNENLINDLEKLAKKKIYVNSIRNNSSSICVIFKKTEDNDFSLPFQDDSMPSDHKNKIANYKKFNVKKNEVFDNQKQIKEIIGPFYWKVIILEVLQFTDFGKIILSKLIYKLFKIKNKYYTDVGLELITLKNVKDFIQSK